MNPIEARVVVDAAPAAVWRALTDPEAMARWMGEPEMRLEVITTWRVGDPIVVRGIHHVPFENDGTVLAFEPERLLRYTHRSSVSRLPDEGGSYSTIEYRLTRRGNGTEVALNIEGFPTDSIRRHLRFYWPTTLSLFKTFVEKSERQP